MYFKDVLHKKFDHNNMQIKKKNFIKGKTSRANNKHNGRMITNRTFTFTTI